MQVLDLIISVKSAQIFSNLALISRSEDLDICSFFTLVKEVTRIFGL